MFFPELYEDIALAHLLKAIFHCSGSLVQRIFSQTPGAIDPDLLHFQHRGFHLLPVAVFTIRSQTPVTIVLSSNE